MSESHSPQKHRFQKRRHKVQLFQKSNSGRTSNSKFFARLKNDKNLSKNLILLAIAIFLLTAFILLAELVTQKDPAAEERSPETKLSILDDNSSILLSAPFFEDEVYLVNEATLACVNADPSTDIKRLLRSYREGDARLDIAYPVLLSFDIAGLPSGTSVTGIVVEILEEGAASPRVFSLDGQKRSISIPHLKTDTSYTYRINVKLSGGSTTAMEGSFRTADTPRILSVDGIVNVRDVGGWKTTDGKTVRQGLIYRGSELDGAVEPAFRLTDRGLTDMHAVFGIRTDMDLRSSSDNAYGTHPLGASVEHIYYNAPMYTDAFTQKGKERLRTVFADLADSSKYPVYLHCTYGQDRTGTVCYLLEAILGLSDDDLMTDYQLSALYYGSVSQDSMNTFVSGLADFGGSTVREQAENYLLSIGVTQKELEQIRAIMLE